ncbi:S41 family peptidase [Caulobacter sp. UC70_42]|uniref:S41 family peptidase n=1 Tax=Caulobacter sp. UC70_42 TaxID=3374551 RepID=UPI003757FF95
MKRLGAWALAAIALAMTEPCSTAAAQDWKALTRADLASAAGLIRDNHPAMVPAIGDKDFVARFDASLAKATARLDKVEDADGMAAVLRGFRSRSRRRPHRMGEVRRRPAEGLAGLRRHAPGPGPAGDHHRPRAPPAGAKLVDCDGVPAPALLRQRTADRVPDPDIDAQLTINSIWVVLDDGNPFISRPRTCRFQAEGHMLEHTLAYRPATPADLQRIRDERKFFGHAGFGVRQVGQAWWIAMESLNDSAPAVLDAAKARQAQLRTAPLVVIDLRGNGGGNSLYGDRLAEILLGEAPLKQVRSGGSGRACAPVWRASPDNRKTLDLYAAKFADDADAWRMEAARMDAALAAGQPLTGPVDGCEVVERRAPPPAHPLFAGKLVVVTDVACFSSCPLVVKRLRSLGAIQVGTATNAPTRYMEVRAIDLPSGLGRFTTMQKAAVSSPPMIGPYSPDIAFTGDISDTKALEAWIPSAVR